MKRIMAVAGLVLFVFMLISCAPQKPDRAALVDVMEQYLVALADHNPDAVPLAKDVKLVENTKPTAIGEGLWKTATGGPTDFKIFVADPVAGQVATICVIEENEKPTILGARLKLVDGKITEIDHLVVHSYNDQPLSTLMSTVNPILLKDVDPAERDTREDMLKIADSYYEALVQDNGSLCPFTDDCQRRENGGISANDQTQSPEEAANDDFSVFRKMKAGEQLDTGVMSYITDINDRRFIAVDEQKGLVFVFSIFRHDGEPKVMKIIGVPGITERANKYGPFDLPAAHIYKIKNGQMYDIEAIGYIAKHGITNGWE